MGGGLQGAGLPDAPRQRPRQDRPHVRRPHRAGGVHAPAAHGRRPRLPEVAGRGGDGVKGGVERGIAARSWGPLRALLTKCCVMHERQLLYLVKLLSCGACLTYHLSKAGIQYTVGGSLQF